jgi:general secretion pathway protein F
MLAAAALLRRYLTREQNRARIDRMLLRLPLLGDLIRRLDVARFTRALGTLLQNGVPLLACVDIAGAALSNRTLCATLPTVIDSLKQGRGMAMPLLATGQFPRLTVQLIRIGEESGQLDSMLLRSADILDTEIKQRIQSLISILEPALIVVLGIVIAGILMSILTAILGMNDIAL